MITREKSFTVLNTLAYFGTASVKIHDKGIGSIDLSATEMVTWKKSFMAKNTLAYFGRASVKIHDKGIG